MSTPAPAEHTQAPGGICPPPVERAHPPLPEERDFDFKVYGVLGTGVTAVVSAMMAYWAKYGPGKERCARLAESFGESLRRISGGTRERCARVAHSWVMTTALMSGGIAMLFPLRHEEKHKAAIVKADYEKRKARQQAQGEAVPDEVRAQEDARMAELEKEPEIGWWQIIPGRLAGTAAVYGVMGVAGQQIERFSEHSGEAMARAAGAGKASFTGKFGELLVFDIIASAICTAGLYVYTHTLCPPSRKPKTVFAKAEASAALAGMVDIPVTGNNSSTLPAGTPTVSAPSPIGEFQVSTAAPQQAHTP